jgi:quercetin dioxygenase-like cupin family protein
MTAPRRIVTGHDLGGRSVVLSDGAVPVSRTLAESGVIFHEVWRTGASPAPIAPDEPEPTERAVRVAPDAGGTVIRVIEFEPGHLADGLQSPMHRTASVDYGIVLAGELVLVLPDSEVALRAGDIVIQRGTDHAWANRSDAPARMAFVLVDGRFSDDLDLPAETGLDATHQALE